MGAALRALLSTPAVARAFYDAQCEVCQAFAAWLRVLDRRGRVECVPISDDAVRAHGLDLAACLRQLHVVAPDGRVRAGWDAVAYLARRLSRHLADRRARIGQPEALERPVKTLGSELATASGRLIVLPSPGHCADHVVLYDPERRVLLAGDAFMGTYFATPNADVDSVRWLETLARLLELDVEGSSRATATSARCAPRSRRSRAW